MNQAPQSRCNDHSSQMWSMTRNSRLLSFITSLCLSSIIVLIITYLCIYIALDLVDEDYGYIIYFYGLPSVIGIIFVATVVVHHKIYTLQSSHRFLYESGVVSGGLFAMLIRIIPNYYLTNSRPAWLTPYIEHWSVVMLTCWLFVSAVSGLIFIPLQRYSDQNTTQK